MFLLTYMLRSCERKSKEIFCLCRTYKVPFRAIFFYIKHDLYMLTFCPKCVADVDVNASEVTLTCLRTFSVNMTELCLLICRCINGLPNAHN